MRQVGVVRHRSHYLAGRRDVADLNCVASDVLYKLRDDAHAVAIALKVRNVPRGGGKDLPPQNQ